MNKRHLNQAAFDSHYNLKNDSIVTFELELAFIRSVYCPLLMSPVEFYQQYECH